MGMEVPGAVSWLLPIVVGESWPEGDEDKLRALRDAWHSVSAAFAPAATSGNQAATTVLSEWEGEGAEAFRKQWQQLTEGDQAPFKALADAAQALANSCDATALEIEYIKYTIILSLILLAAQIAVMIGAAIITFGTSTAGIPLAQLATRAAIATLFRQLIAKLAQQGFTQIAKELLGLLLKNAVIGALLNTLAGGLAQIAQKNEDSRKDFDDEKFVRDAATGAIVGGVDALGRKVVHGMAGGHEISRVATVARDLNLGAASQIASALAMDGKISFDDVLTGATSNAIGNSTESRGHHSSPGVSLDGAIPTDFSTPQHPSSAPNAHPEAASVQSHQPAAGDNSPAPHANPEPSSAPRVSIDDLGQHVKGGEGAATPTGQGATPTHHEVKMADTSAAGAAPAAPPAVAPAPSRFAADSAPNQTPDVPAPAQHQPQAGSSNNSPFGKVYGEGAALQDPQGKQFNPAQSPAGTPNAAPQAPAPGAQRITGDLASVGAGGRPVVSAINPTDTGNPGVNPQNPGGRVNAPVSMNQGPPPPSGGYYGPPPQQESGGGYQSYGGRPAQGPAGPVGPSGRPPTPPPSQPPQRGPFSRWDTPELTEQTGFGPEGNLDVLTPEQQEANRRDGLWQEHKPQPESGRRRESVPIAHKDTGPPPPHEDPNLAQKLGEVAHLSTESMPHPGRQSSVEQAPMAENLVTDKTSEISSRTPLDQPTHREPEPLQTPTRKTDSPIRPEPDLAEPAPVATVRVETTTAPDPVTPDRSRILTHNESKTEQTPNAQPAEKPVHVPLTLGGQDKSADSTPNSPAKESPLPVYDRGIFEKLGVNLDGIPTTEHPAVHSTTKETTGSPDSNPDTPEATGHQGRPTATVAETSGVSEGGLRNNANDRETAVWAFNELTKVPDVSTLGIVDRKISIDSTSPLFGEFSSLFPEGQAPSTQALSNVLNKHEQARGDAISQRYDLELTIEAHRRRMGFENPDPFSTEKYLSAEGRESHLQVTKVEHNGSKLVIEARQVFDNEPGFNPDSSSPLKPGDYENSGPGPKEPTTPEPSPTSQRFSDVLDSPGKEAEPHEPQNPRFTVLDGGSQPTNKPGFQESQGITTVSHDAPQRSIDFGRRYQDYGSSALMSPDSGLSNQSQAVLDKNLDSETETLPRVRVQAENQPTENLLLLKENYLSDRRVVANAEDFHAIDEIFLNTNQINRKTNELPHEQLNHKALELRDKNSVAISREGARAVHAYTQPQVKAPLTQRLHTGEGLTIDHIQQTRAITSGLNELPVHNGTVVYQKSRALHNYTPGETLVETGFRNATPEQNYRFDKRATEHQVELHVQSKFGRDISGLDVTKAKDHIVFPPGTQLRVVSSQEVIQKNLRGAPTSRLVVHAQELAPGEPGYLDNRAVQHKVNEQRRLARTITIEKTNSYSKKIGGLLNSLDIEAGSTNTLENLPSSKHHPALGKPPGGWAELNKKNQNHKYRSDSPRYR